MKGKWGAICRSSVAAGILLLSLSAGSQDTWKIVGPGGGGTTVGPTISPHNPRLVVEHCDMTGGYLSSNGAACPGECSTYAAA